MALETLKGIKQVGDEKVIVMDELREQFPERFTPTGAMDHVWFERDIRPNAFIYVRNDKNSLAFTLQNGPIGEVGKNGCQVTDILRVCRVIYQGLNDKYPCAENADTISYLNAAISVQDLRTRNRTARGVEGTSKA